MSLALGPRSCLVADRWRLALDSAADLILGRCALRPRCVDCVSLFLPCQRLFSPRLAHILRPIGDVMAEAVSGWRSPSCLLHILRLDRHQSDRVRHRCNGSHGLSLRSSAFNFFNISRNSSSISCNVPEEIFASISNNPHLRAASTR